MIENERAAQPGRKGGGDRKAGVPKDHHENGEAASRHRVISDPAQRWLDQVELRASPGLAGSTERKLAKAIIEMLAPGRDSLVASLAEFGAAAGVGEDGVAAALRRLRDKRFVYFDSSRGRTLKTVVALRFGGR